MKNVAGFLACQAGVVPKFQGDPGTGKTATINAWSRAAQRPIYTLIGSIREPSDIAGYPMLKNGDQPACMEFVPPSWVRSINKQPSVLFIDELTCCPPSVQAALLRVMAEGYVGDTQLRPDTWILAACNPPEHAAGGYELEPPMANRLCHLSWEMDWGSWTAGLMNGLNFPDPQAPILPKDWEKHIGGVCALVAGFQNRKPSLFLDFPKERSKQSGAWPSPRSWTNAIRCDAAAKSVNASDEVRYELLGGCVGLSVADEYYTWIRNLDLPDTTELLDDAEKAVDKGRPVPWKHLARPDMTMAALGGVVSLALERNNAKSWVAAMHLIEGAGEKSMDIAIAAARPLSLKIPKGARLPESLTKVLAPMLVEVYS